MLFIDFQLKANGKKYKKAHYEVVLKIEQPVVAKMRFVAVIRGTCKMETYKLLLLLRHGLSSYCTFDNQSITA